MIKRTLYFGNPAYLSKKDEQLVIRVSSTEKEETKTTEENSEEVVSEPDIKYKARTEINTVPVEDIGIIILDSPQITITQGLLSSLLENNTALVSCDKSHLPAGLFLPLSVNQVQSERFQAQIDTSVPLKKQLWQQTISQKIKNQAWLLNKRHIPVVNMLMLIPVEN